MIPSQLADAAAFFDKLRHGDLLGPTLSQGEVDGIKALLSAAGAAGWGLAWTAYALATAYHETAGAMVPVRERGGPEYFRRKYDPQGLNPNLARRLGNISPGDGVRYAGRGQVQITGRGQYHRAGEALGLQLVEHPDIALQLDIGARILVWGLEAGGFTGAKLAAFLPTGPLAAAREQLVAARRTVNGNDRADLVAGYALIFQDALALGGWGPLPPY